MKKQGFIEGILSDAARNSIVDRCKDENGKIDVNRALSVTRAMGYTSSYDRHQVINYANRRNNEHSNNN